MAQLEVYSAMSMSIAVLMLMVVLFLSGMRHGIVK